VFEFEKPVGFARGAVFTVTMQQLYRPEPGHNIGRFRLAVTTSKRPLAVTGPPEGPGAVGPAARNTPGPDGFVPLFNGKDLSGWQTHDKQPGDWYVEDGALTCRGRQSHLFSERGDFENFHLRAEVRISPGSNSGLFFRSEISLLKWGGTQALPLGYEVEMLPGYVGPLLDYVVPQPNPKMRTGVGVAPKGWFNLEVIAEGDHVQVRVDGKTTVDCRLPPGHHRRGHFALQHFTPETHAEFRKIEIKELPATPP
jgi:hypothetical protein